MVDSAYLDRAVIVIRIAGPKVAGLIALALSLAFALSPGVLAQGLFNQGDYWVYDLSSTTGNATAIGSLNVSYAGMTTRLLSGHTYDVYDVAYNANYTWSGSISGTSRVVEHVYVDVSSQDTIIDEYNQSDSLTITSGGSSGHFNGWTYNKTTYMPPGGNGTWPSILYKGETWTITYTETYEERSYNGSLITSTSGTLVDVITYDVTGSETVTVLAGTFDCTVIQESTVDSTFTRWYSDKVGNDVKVVSEPGSGESTTMALTSYSHGGSSPERGSALYVGLGVAVAAAAVAFVAVLIYLRGKRNRPTSVPPTYVVEQPPKEPYY